jgi:DHA1 family bicyclomycin/chloramphenicol resistance-like MFS transporter
LRNFFIDILSIKRQSPVGDTPRVAARHQQELEPRMNFSTFSRNAIILGLLTAVGPFAIDMYLPALPMIAADLHAPTAATQMTLTAFLAAFGVCQIVYGPVSDMVGRKPPLFFGLAIFLAGSIGCASAASMRWLIAFRALQGIGASAAMVIPRAIVRDLHTGRNATRLMALVMLIFSVSPILAPLVGSGLIAPFGWRAVFVGVACVAVIAIFLVAILLPETRPPEKRVGVSLDSVLGGFGQLLRHGRFVGLTLIGAFGMASFLAFLANSAFIYIDHFGLTPTQYSFAFAVNAISFFGSSQFAATLGARFGMSRVVLAAVALNAFFDLILFALTAASYDSLPLLMALLFCAFACLGLVTPSTMVLALEEHGPIAGMAWRSAASRGCSQARSRSPSSVSFSMEPRDRWSPRSRFARSGR